MEQLPAHHINETNQNKTGTNRLVSTKLLSCSTFSSNEPCFKYLSFMVRIVGKKSPYLLLLLITFIKYNTIYDFRLK